MTHVYVQATELRDLLAEARSGTCAGELALVDVREEGEFGEGHPLWAINIPYSRLELLIRALVPRLSCPIVLIDQGRGVSERAARRLVDIGYLDVRILKGGISAWAAQRLELFKGVYVPGKVFGEWVEHQFGTPTLTAHDLLRYQLEGKDVVVLDPRTLAEHNVRHVPGALPCPGGELLRYIKDLAPSPSALVVLACGGRTRGIVAAQTLINAGLANPVAALADGNHGWILNGYQLEQQTQHCLEPPSIAALEYGQQRSAHLARQGTGQSVSADSVAVWLADSNITTYLLDVRDPDSFSAEHLTGSRNAPGGQLLQAIDRWVGVLGARLVLIDDDTIRARQIAYWTQAMGWPTWVVRGGIAAAEAAGLDLTRYTPKRGLRTGVQGADEAAAVHPQIDSARRVAPQIEPLEALQYMENGIAGWVLDSSADYIRRHPAGSRWINRAYLDAAMYQAAAGKTVLLFSQNGDAAHLAAVDLIESAITAGVMPQVWVVSGGIEEWVRLGLPLSTSASEGLRSDECVDFLAWAANRRNGDQTAMRQYLDWERQLLEQLGRDGSVFERPRRA